MLHYYNLPDVYVISHGECADPEIAYDGKVYNCFEVRCELEKLYEISDDKGNFSSMEEWIAANSSDIYAILEMLEGDDAEMEQLVERLYDLSPVPEMFIKNIHVQYKNEEGWMLEYDALGSTFTQFIKKSDI